MIFEDSLFEECYFEDVTSSNTFFRNCTFINTVFYNTGKVEWPVAARPKGWVDLEEGSRAQGSQAELSGALEESGMGPTSYTNNSKSLMGTEHFPVTVRISDKRIKFLCLCPELKQLNSSNVLLKRAKIIQNGVLGEKRKAIKEVFGGEKVENLCIGPFLSW